MTLLLPVVEKTLLDNFCYSFVQAVVLYVLMFYGFRYSLPVVMPCTHLSAFSSRVLNYLLIKIVLLFYSLLFAVVKQVLGEGN